MSMNERRQNLTEAYGPPTGPPDAWHQWRLLATAAGELTRAATTVPPGEQLARADTIIESATARSRWTAGTVRDVALTAVRAVMLHDGYDFGPRWTEATVASYLTNDRFSRAQVVAVDTALNLWARPPADHLTGSDVDPGALTDLVEQFRTVTRTGTPRAPTLTRTTPAPTVGSGPAMPMAH